MDIFKLIAVANSLDASDLHLSAYGEPLIRVNGELTSFPDQTPLTESEMNEAFQQLVGWEDIEKFNNELELDAGRVLPDGTRLRISAAQQRGVISLTIRLIPAQIPTIDDLELPQIFKKLATLHKGLIVVSGPTGSGKTTTQAAMIKYINMNKTRHVLTFEDPIEYSHPNIQSRITQRELGGDTHSMSEALKHAMRHDPDVIVVGEMRDSETASAVISLAETGHMIISTSHAPYAPQTIERIIDLFPNEERFLMQTRLASLLTAVLCQTLVPRADGSGRIAVVEIMMINSAIRNLIHEGKVALLSNAVRDYRNSGNVTLDEALIDLYYQKVITSDTVTSYCHDPDEVSKLLAAPLLKAKKPSGRIH